MKKYKLKKANWVATSLALFEKLAKLEEDQLTNSEARILFYLISKLKTEDNILSIKQKEIATELNITKKTISKAFSKFIKLDIITKISNLKSSIMINPNIIWLGGWQHKEENIEIYSKIKSDLFLKKHNGNIKSVKDKIKINKIISKISKESPLLNNNDYEIWEEIKEKEE